MKTPATSFLLRLRLATHRELESFALESNISMNELVVCAVEEFLEAARVKPGDVMLNAIKRRSIRSIPEVVRD